MTPLLQEINKKMNNYLSQLADSQEIFETKEVCGKFVLDGLASCAFGVETGSFDDDSEFLSHAKKVFGGFSGFSFLKLLYLPLTPNIIKKAAAKLGIVSIFRNVLANEHTKFLMHVVEESFNQRKASQTKRNDLLDMMIEAVDGTVDEVQEEDIHATEQYEKDAKIVGHVKNKTLSYDDIISTALLMLSAGYDTTGTALSYILYELAINQDSQDTLLEEIKEAASDANKLSYETIQSLTYLDAVIHESMRKHPIISLLTRVCTKDYKVPGYNFTMPKGMEVLVNNVGICHDPEIFPNPKEFIPERFTRENASKRNPYAWMGFSLGPRNCLAMRFAMFEMKVCVSNLVSNFKLLPCDKTVRDVEWDPRSFLGEAKGGLWIKCEKR